MVGTSARPSHIVLGIQHAFLARISTDPHPGHSSARPGVCSLLYGFPFDGRLLFASPRRRHRYWRNPQCAQSNPGQPKPNQHATRPISATIYRCLGEGTAQRRRRHPRILRPSHEHRPGRFWLRCAILSCDYCEDPSQVRANSAAAASRDVEGQGNGYHLRNMLGAYPATTLSTTAHIRAVLQDVQCWFADYHQQSLLASYRRVAMLSSPAPTRPSSSISSPPQSPTSNRVESTLNARKSVAQPRLRKAGTRAASKFMPIKNKESGMFFVVCVLQTRFDDVFQLKIAVYIISCSICRLDVLSINFCINLTITFSSIVHWLSYMSHATYSANGIHSYANRIRLRLRECRRHRAQL